MDDGDVSDNGSFTQSITGFSIRSEMQDKMLFGDGAALDPSAHPTVNLDGKVAGVGTFSSIFHAVPDASAGDAVRQAANRLLHTSLGAPDPTNIGAELNATIDPGRFAFLSAMFGGGGEGSVAGVGNVFGGMAEGILWGKSKFPTVWGVLTLMVTFVACWEFLWSSVLGFFWALGWSNLGWIKRMMGLFPSTAEVSGTPAPASASVSASIDEDDDEDVVADFDRDETVVQWLEEEDQPRPFNRHGREEEEDKYLGGGLSL
jgi:hypothetical protein